MSDLIVELCLSVPARPSSILPYLHLLMRPVVCALHSASEQLVSLGLRTLEFWIDNLQASPCLSPPHSPTTQQPPPTRNF